MSDTITRPVIRELKQSIRNYFKSLTELSVGNDEIPRYQIGVQVDKETSEKFTVVPTFSTKP